MRTTREISRLAPVVPVITIERIEDAVPLGCALVAGGLPVLEVTLRTPVALEAIRLLAAECEGAVVGAGTLRTPADVEACLKAGAVFAVSPGASPKLLDAAEATGVVQRRGSYYFFGEERLGQGREKTLETLKTNDDLRTTIDSHTRQVLVGKDVNEIYVEEQAEVSADAEGVERISVD